MLIFSKRYFKLTITTLVAVFTLGVFAQSVQAQTTYFVDGDIGNDVNSCTAPGSACQTINAALAKVVAGDTVKIAPSANPYNESITVPAGDLTIEGTGQHAEGVEINQGLSNTMDNVTIRNLFINAANTQAILSSGNLTLEKVVLTGHAQYCGGALSLLDSYQSRGYPYYHDTFTTIKDSTLTGSTAATDGGAICARSGTTLEIINSVISGNEATGSKDSNYYGWGGAIYVWGGDVSLYNTTVTGNEALKTGGAFYVVPGIGYSLKLYNSLVADNSANGVPQNCDANGNIQDGAYNLADENSCGNPNVSGLFTVSGDPLLDSLGDNGGFTPTHELLEGSPAIDAGDPDGCKGPDGAVLENDQTGHQRVGRCDIGSYEFVPAGWVPPSNDPAPTDPGSDPSSGGPAAGSPGSTVLTPGSTGPAQDGGIDDNAQVTDGTAFDGPASGGCSMTGSASATHSVWLMGMVLLGFRFLYFRRRK